MLALLADVFDVQIPFYWSRAQYGSAEHPPILGCIVIQRQEVLRWQEVETDNLEACNCD